MARVKLMPLPKDIQKFKSDESGELALCTRCYRKGYGVDSYHPATSEFWTVGCDGRISLSLCRACVAEGKSRNHGQLDEKMPSSFVESREGWQRGGEAAYYSAADRGLSFYGAGESFA